MSVKDLYMDELEAEAERLVEQGMDPDDAYEAAGTQAYLNLPDRCADLADAARQRAKDGDL